MTGSSHPDSFSARADLTVGEQTYEIFRLDAVPGADRLPYSLKVLLENLLRSEDGANITADDIRGARRLGSERSTQQGDPVHAGPGDHAGLHRRARHRRPRDDA